MPRGHYKRTLIPIAIRLASHVTKTDTCWLWTGCKSAFGHGQIGAGAHEPNTPKRLLQTHRVAWELVNGPIPDGMFVLHRCDVPNCVRPDHLFLGTKADNSADMISKSRQKKGRDLPQTKLSAADVANIRESVEPQRVLADRYGVSRSTISYARTRRNWSHI